MAKAPAALNRSGQSRLALNATGARYSLYRNFSGPDSNSDIRF